MNAFLRTNFSFIAFYLVFACGLHAAKVDGFNVIKTVNDMGFTYLDNQPIKAHLFDAVKDRQDAKVLFVGAGFDQTPHEIATLENVAKVTVNDLDARHLKDLRSHKNPKLVFDVGDFTTIQRRAIYKINEYDAIYASNVIHFLSPSLLMKFFDITSSMLKTGGRLIIISSCLPDDSSKDFLAADKGKIVRTQNVMGALVSLQQELKQQGYLFSSYVPKASHFHSVFNAFKADWHPIMPSVYRELFAAYDLKEIVLEHYNYVSEDGFERASDNGSFNLFVLSKSGLEKEANEQSPTRRDLLKKKAVQEEKNIKIYLKKFDDQDEL